MTNPPVLLDLLIVCLTSAATVIAWRHSLGAALGLLLATLVASHTELDWIFLTARWAALFTLAVLLVAHLYSMRLPRSTYVPWASIAVVPVVCLASAAWSIDPRLSASRAVALGVLLLVAACSGIVWMLEERQRPSYADGIAVATVAVLVASIAYALVSDAAFLNDDLRGIFGNPNHLGMLLGIGYLFVAAALERRGLASARLVALCVFAGTTAVSSSRSGLGALLLSAVGYELARRRYAWAALAPLGAASAAVAAVLLVGGLQGPEPGTKFEAGPSVSEGPASGEVGEAAASSSAPPFVVWVTGGRNEAWEEAAGLLADKPVLGYGFGTGDRLFDRYVPADAFLYFGGGTPHNGYLQAVLELGVLALVVLVPLVALGWLAIRVLVRDRRLAATAASLSVLAGLSVGIVESTFTSPGGPWSMLLWTSAAMCLALTLDRAAPSTSPVAAVDDAERDVAALRRPAGDLVRKSHASRSGSEPANPRRLAFLRDARRRDRSRACT